MSSAKLETLKNLPFRLLLTAAATACATILMAAACGPSAETPAAPAAPGTSGGSGAAAQTTQFRQPVGNYHHVFRAGQAGRPQYVRQPVG